MSLLKKTVLASIGAFEVTKAKADKIIDELIRKGDLSRSDRKAAIMELLDRAQKSGEKLRSTVLKEAEKAKEGASKLKKDFEWVRRSEYKKLEGKLSRLSKKVPRSREAIESLVVVRVSMGKAGSLANQRSRRNLLGGITSQFKEGPWCWRRGSNPHTQ